MRSRLSFLVVLLAASVTGVMDARASGRLFVNSGTTGLEERDPLTGAVIGTIPLTGTSGFMGAFAYDKVTDTIYMSNTSNDNLWRIDYHAGTATLIGPFNLGGADVMHGLAIDDTSGFASYPGGITPNPISVGGATIVAGDIRHYQCWYRDAAPFCTADTFNLSQGLALSWAP